MNDKIKILINICKTTTIKLYRTYSKKIRNFSLKNRTDVVILVAASVAILFCVGYFIGANVSSKQQMLKKFEIALQKKKYSSISKYCIFDNKKTNKNDIKPFVDYYNTDEKIKSLMNDLNMEKDGVVSLKSKKSLFNKKYYIKIKPVNIDVKVKYKDTKLYLNKKEIGTSAKDEDLISVTSILPGEYSIEAINKNDYNTIRYTGNITAVYENNEKSIDLNANRVSIETEYKDADVYINNKKLKIKAGEFKNQGPIDNNSTSKIYIVEELPWGSIKSDEVKLASNPILHFNMNLLNKELESQLNTKIKEVIESIFEAVHNENYEIIKAKNKEKIYNEFKEEKKLLKNKYELSDYNCEVDKADVKKQGNEYFANIYTTLNYKVSKSLFGLDLFSEERERKIFFKIVISSSYELQCEDILIVK